MSNMYRRYTQEQIEELNDSDQLWGCLVCGHECDSEIVSDNCPKCNSKVLDD